MAHIVADFVRNTCAAPSGSAAFASLAAVTGYQEFDAVLGASDTCHYGASDASGNWEVGLGTWDDTAKTLTRTTILASSNSGSAESFSGTVTVELVDPARQVGQSFLFSKTHDGTAAVTGEVNTLHIFTALTADRDFSLPSAAATGDRVGVCFTVSSASYEILLKSATNDKINDVVASTTEWSRLFIAGEFVIFRCIDGSTVDWVVEEDGRIPCVARFTNSGVSQPSAATLYYPAWTVVFDNGSLYTDTTNDCATIRRAGRYHLAGMHQSHNHAGNNTDYGGLIIDPNGSPAYLGTQIRTYSITGERSCPSSSGTFDLAVGNAVTWVTLHNDSGATRTTGPVNFTLHEVF